ncbi:hypothetical protein V1264_007891 [Littorina saxatilis]
MSPTLNGDPDLATYPCTSASAQLLKLVTSASQIGNEHIPQSARNVGGHSPTIINRSTPLMTGENEALKMGYPENQEVMELNKENSPVYRTPTELDRDPAKGRSLMKNFESEPLASLSRTSSLLREVHQFAEQEEESEEGGGTLEDEVEAARLNERAAREQVLRSGTNGGGTTPLGRRLEHEREEPVTYHVLGNSALVKFEPGAGVESEQQNSTNGLRAAVGTEAGGEAAAVDGSGFDGQTITLVEDEHNVGTFKIAQIGVDNTLRVIDNDRIVVFQDETAVTSVCKQEVLQPESDKVHEEESPSACISRSFHALNNDNINIPDAYRTATTATDNVGLYEDGSQRGQRRRDAASGFDHNATERVATFSETGVLRGLHSAEAALHAGQPLQPRPVLGPSPSGFPGVGNCQVKSWHYPTDREAPPPPPPNTLTHFVGDASSSFAGANGSSEPGSVSAPTSSSSSAASIHPQSYPEYGVSSSGVPPAATQHGSYTELGAAAFPGYAPGVATWSVPGQPENVLAYSMPEGAEQKTGVGYGHPHAPVYTAIPPSFLSSGPGSGYVGYAGDVGRSWRAAKSNEATELAHNGRESTLYHQHQQHQHPPQQPPHPGAYTPVPIVRPYATYPGWENAGAHPPPRHVRYMAPVGARGRSSSRIHKTRHSGMPVQTATNTGHLANMVTPRSSAPVLVSPAMVGRPRKRSTSSHVDHAAVAKAGGFQPESNIHKGEPQRKRARDQHHNQQQQQQQQQQSAQQQQGMPLSALSTVSSNVHTLKPGHIIAWYIDYLIHENEDRTQISRAFTLPVNLFHTDDFYFLDSLRKKIRFPSAKFLAWMQCHLPSLNAHAIDFREGRASCDAASSVTSWNQDWGWQNKSKRDIIHDVFFYFQHRKAASTEPHQFMGVGGRTKAQLVVQ